MTARHLRIRAFSCVPGRGRGLAWALVATLAASPLAAAEAGDYRLQPGDVVEISILGLPDMRIRSAIQFDGSLNLPMVGSLPARGSTMADVRSQIQSALASRVLTTYASDGHEVLRTVERDEVTADVAEYRPIFVSGDVARPGERAFRPQITVRQAFAAAGGATAAPGSAGIPYDGIGLRADYVRRARHATSPSGRHAVGNPADRG
jgi:polysaccharide export outer membrane protein